ncbi:hypothetical protein ATJ97_2578 [Georgenia soli]|uniref:Leucine rich repeat variant domain-containing protein n=1 Tax=Georgenia soli TaxID=638953 RepID=A0A2A9EMB4_9MICO|nr:hypothetical protein [Georgenia soli]PFG40058.1 hypothetical protein ATJ97_2578 [Georgenia soli]
MDGGNDLERQAADPGTPLTTLQQLAQHHPELRAIIAENPSTYPALLEWLGRLRMPDVDAALARRAARAAGGAAGMAAPVPPPSAGTPTADPATQPMERVDPVRPAGATQPTAAVQPADATQPMSAAQPTDEPLREGPDIDPSPTVVVPRVPLAERRQAPVERVPEEDRPHDAEATAVYSDPDELAARTESPPSFAPTQRVEPPTAAQPDAPTTAMPPVVPTWTPTRGTPAQSASQPADDFTAHVLEPATAHDQHGPRRKVGDRGHHPTTPAHGRPVAAAPPGERRKWPSWLPLAILAAVALILVLIVIFQLSGGEDEAPPRPGATSAQAQSSASATAESSPADNGEAARAALVGLPEATSCADPATDAGTFGEFAQTAAPDGAWADPASGELVITTLQQLQASCDSVYAVSVASAITGDDAAPEALRTTVTDAGTGWVELVRAAPPGAQETSSFASPSQNIACELGDSARCTIGEHDFPQPEDCSGPTTMAVSRDAGAGPDCSQPVGGADGVLDYGQSATSGFFACTSEESGMTCWNTLTGRGFSVARAGYQTF